MSLSSISIQRPVLAIDDVIQTYSQLVKDSVAESVNILAVTASTNNGNRGVNSGFLVSQKEVIPSIDTTTIFSGKSSLLIVTEREIDIANQQLKESNSNYLPKLSLNAAYNYTRNQSQAGLTLLNKSTGPNIGLSFNWNIFDGFSKNRVRNVGLINIDIAKYRHYENKLAQFAIYQKALIQYKTALKILILERESFQLAMKFQNKDTRQAVSVSLNIKIPN